MLEMLKESNGNMSSIRVIAFMIASAVVSVWSYTSIRSGVIQPMDLSTVTLVLGSLGAKVGQKFGEK